jgi:ribonuclease HII
MLSGKDFIIAGTDEAGRGPLAGPVVASAVILTFEQRATLVKAGLKDSKKMTEASRERMFQKICELGIIWRAQAASPARIDKMNILRASLWCMRRSVEKLPSWPDLTLVDGNQLIPGLLSEQKCIIKGDNKVPAIAAASVIAKVLRDRAMRALDKIYPQYGFAVHKGYPSAEHRKILKEIGPSPVHRFSFRGVVAEKKR